MHETHTGVVVLVGDKAYKAKKPVATDFLDFSTPDRRERACVHEVHLNSRLAPDSYLGVGHFSDPQGGPAEPVIVMRRYRGLHRLATLVKNGQPVEDHLVCHRGDIGAVSRGCGPGPRRSTHCGTVDAIAARWQANLDELQRYADTVLPR